MAFAISTGEPGMVSVPTFVRRHAVATYFAVTFAISWGGVLLAVGIQGFPRSRDQFEGILPVAIAAMLLGPSLAGLGMTALCHGESGWRELRARLFTWRLGLQWYAAGVLMAPVVTLAVLLGLSLGSPSFLPGLFTVDDPARHLTFGLTAGVAVGVLEELGWTGFAVPMLRREHPVLTTGLVVGIIWGAWHIMGQVVLASGTYSGDLARPIFFIASTAGLLIGTLPAFRVLMVWAYDRTGSLLLSILMHVSLTATTITMEPVGISGTALLLVGAISTAAWWGVVGVVAWSTHGVVSQVHRARPRWL